MIFYFTFISPFIKKCTCAYVYLYTLFYSADRIVFKMYAGRKMKKRPDGFSRQTRPSVYARFDRDAKAVRRRRRRRFIIITVTTSFRQSVKVIKPLNIRICAVRFEPLCSTTIYYICIQLRIRVGLMREEETALVPLPLLQVKKTYVF